MTSEEHLTTVITRTETDGSLLGRAYCEICGAVSREAYLDEHESDLKQIAAEHWVNGSDALPVLPAQIEIPIADG